MADMRIEFDILRNAMRHSIDAAVHTTITQYEKELGENTGLAFRLARIAAESAMEQFATFCNHELRMLQLEYERRAGELRIRPLDPMGLTRRG